MSFLNLELSSALAGDLGWTLVHFLWQGVALALLLQAVLPLCRSAVARHNWALGMLAAMCLAPVVTFLWLHRDGGAASASAAGTNLQAMTITLGSGFAPASASVPWTGWLVGFWLAGVALLSLRTLGGLVLSQGLRRNGLALPDDLLRRCRDLQQRVAVRLPVRFLQSRQVTVPIVIGWLRPIILLPVSAITGLAPQELDALILHELAHIRRLDAFINVILMMAETVLFYHPAIWWVAKRVRIEREHCCDDIAVAHCGGAAVYVEALASLEMGRAVPVLALAANGGRLKDRAARLLGVPSDKTRFSLSAVAGLAFLSLVIGTVATAQINTQANKQDFAIRVVDESAGKDALQGPAGDDRVRMAQPGGSALWLKREEKIDGDALADARVSVDHGKPVIEFRLTPKGASQFAAMTRENIGHRLAVVVNGAVITAPVVESPILGGKGVITGNFATEAEAKALADEMMGTSHPAAPAHHTQ